jgi:hypothetical protein
MPGQRAQLRADPTTMPARSAPRHSSPTKGQAMSTATRVDVHGRGALRAVTELRVVRLGTDQRVHGLGEAVDAEVKHREEPLDDASGV